MPFCNLIGSQCQPLGVQADTLDCTAEALLLVRPACSTLTLPPSQGWALSGQITRPAAITASRAAPSGSAMQASSQNAALPHQLAAAHGSIRGRQRVVRIGRNSGLRWLQLQVLQELVVQGLKRVWRVHLLHSSQVQIAAPGEGPTSLTTGNTSTAAEGNMGRKNSLSGRVASLHTGQAEPCWPL